MPFNSPNAPELERVDSGSISVSANSSTTVDSGVGPGEEIVVFWGYQSDPNAAVRIAETKVWDDGTDTQEVRFAEQLGNSGAEVDYAVYRVSSV